MKPKLLQHVLMQMGFKSQNPSLNHLVFNKRDSHEARRHS